MGSGQATRVTRKLKSRTYFYSLGRVAKLSKENRPLRNARRKGGPRGRPCGAGL